MYTVEKENQNVRIKFFLKAVIFKNKFYFSCDFLFCLLIPFVTGHSGRYTSTENILILLLVHVQICWYVKQPRDNIINAC